MRKLFLLIIISSVLTACGFHLRGHQPLLPELESLKLVTPTSNSQLTKQLEKILQTTQIQLVKKATNKTVILEIINEAFDQRVTSIGSGGQNTVYLLTYTIIYQLLDATGQVLFAPHVITTTRNYSTGSNQVLGDTYVENDLRADMRRDVIYQLLNQLQFYKTPAFKQNHNVP